MQFISRRHMLTSVAAATCMPAVWQFQARHLLADEDPQQPTKKQSEPKENPYADAKFVEGPPPLPAKGNFTVVVLPDTQHYSLEYPANFHAQTEWIVAHAKARRIASVLHLGDITHRSTVAEWEVAQAAMSKLDRVVPYFMVPGNHDYSDGKKICVDRTTRFNKYFPLSKFQDLSTFGGTYDKEPERLENSFHTFSAGDLKYLVVCLEYGPRKDVVRWAGEIVARYPQHRAILVTHAYMYSDDTRYNWQKYGNQQSWSPYASGIAKSSNGDVSDGEDLWNNLVSRYENFVFTVNGHVKHDGLAKLKSTNVAGKSVYQTLVNFQMKPKGGDGWLRLLEFSPDGMSIDAIDYSPTRNQCNVSQQNHFTLHYS